MKKTISVEKLERSEVDTDQLQDTALLLIKTLYNRANDDFAETCESQGSDQHCLKDRERRDALKAIYESLKAIPPRGDKWRHRLS